MLALLVRLAVHESVAQYSIIIKASYEWGYEKLYGPESQWQGNLENREALTAASKVASAESHSVLSAAFIEFASNCGLDNKPGWYLHDLRATVVALLANQYCDEHAEDLAKLYDEINEISSKPFSAESEEEEKTIKDNGEPSPKLETKELDQQ